VLIISNLTKNIRKLFQLFAFTRSIPLLKWWLASFGTLKKAFMAGKAMLKTFNQLRSTVIQPRFNRKLAICYPHSTTIQPCYGRRVYQRHCLNI
jgi:hypothetical protein